jgi:hypothetical protein
MNRVSHRPIVASLCLAIALAACGGSSSTSHPEAKLTSSSSFARDGIAFASCMRSHGVPDFPDPTADGDIPKAKVAPISHSPQFRAATIACSRLLPDGGRGGQLTHAEVEQLRTGMVRFAGCMRSAGVTGWPDPVIGRQGRPTFNLSRIDANAPAIRAGIQRCRRQMPGAIVPYMCGQGLGRQSAAGGGAIRCVGGPAYQYTR